MRMDLFEVTTRPIVTLQDAASFRDDPETSWGTVGKAEIRVVTSEGLDLLADAEQNREEDSDESAPLLPAEEDSEIYEMVYDLDKVFAFFLEYCGDKKHYKL